MCSFPTLQTCGFRPSSKKVSPNNCDNDRQPEIVIRPPKPLRNHLGTLFAVAVVSEVRLCHLNYNNTYSGTVLSYISTWHDHKISPVSKKSTCLTSCLTTSGVPIGDLIVAFCTPYPDYSHEGQRPTLYTFLLIQKLSWGLFLPSSTIRASIKHGKKCVTIG